MVYHGIRKQEIPVTGQVFPYPSRKQWTLEREQTSWKLKRIQEPQKPLGSGARGRTRPRLQVQQPDPQLKSRSQSPQRRPARGQEGWLPPPLCQGGSGAGVEQGAEAEPTRTHPAGCSPLYCAGTHGSGLVQNQLLDRADDGRGGRGHGRSNRQPHRGDTGRGAGCDSRRTAPKVSERGRSGPHRQRLSQTTQARGSVAGPGTCVLPRRKSRAPSLMRAREKTAERPSLSFIWSLCKDGRCEIGLFLLTRPSQFAG